MTENESWAYVGPVNMDRHGRITIPKRWRELLKLKPGDKVLIKIAKEGEA